MRLLVYIPAWNEEESVGSVVHAVRAELPQADVLVIDDGSTDGTVQAARGAGALVAPLPSHQGLGAALQTGYIYALRRGYDVCAHLDADGQHLPAELHALVDAVAGGHCDLALGSRWYSPPADELAAHEGYRPTLVRRLGIGLFRWLLTSTTRHRFTDTTSGFRAANRRVMALFAASYAPDFHELESLQRAVRQGLHIKEFPIHTWPRQAGRSKITPLASSFFIFKGLMVLGIGSFRRAHIERPTKPPPPLHAEPE